MFLSTKKSKSYAAGNTGSPSPPFLRRKEPLNTKWGPLREKEEPVSGGRRKWSLGESAQP